MLVVKSGEDLFKGRRVKRNVVGVQLCSLVVTRLERCALSRVWAMHLFDPVVAIHTKFLALRKYRFDICILTVVLIDCGF